MSHHHDEYIDDLAELREQFPDWRFGTVWATAGTRPDVRNLTASRDGVLLAAPNRFMLAEKIRLENR